MAEYGVRVPSIGVVGSEVQSSDVAKMYARRTNTWFLGNLIYDYTTLCTVEQSPVVGTGKPYPKTHPVQRYILVSPMSHLSNQIHRVSESVLSEP